MVRSFLPVGQGAFYLEQFYDINEDRINIVYDCGSNNGVEYIENAALSNLRYNETIHAVFVSHLHDDHINGIKFLLDNYDVKAIFIPYLPFEHKLYSILEYISTLDEYTEDDFVCKFISGSYYNISELNENTHIYQILPNDGEYNYSNDNIENRSETIKPEEVTPKIRETINNSHNYWQLFDEWEFVPSNYIGDSNSKSTKLTKFTKLLQNDLDIDINKFNNFENIKAIFKENDEKLRKLKGIYKILNKDLNYTSMTLFSGIRNPYYRQMKVPKGRCFEITKNNYCNYIIQRKIMEYCNSHNCISNQIECYNKYNDSCLLSKASGCLYTGDYCAGNATAWKSLNKVYYYYNDYIGCIQIPHHGSKRSYNKNFLNYDAYNVISTGENPYGHPHGTVIQSIMNNGRPLFLVTECTNSSASFIVYKD